jgi:FSR family fosmidomycin resistance protein-like MFS transporter
MQLSALASVHFLIDMFASMLPAILPAILREFSLSLSRGGLVMAAMYITCNGVQPLAGRMRSGKRQPLLLHLGLILGAAICLLGALPRADAAFSLMLLLAVVSGVGIAIVHPEGLRAVHRLKRIQPGVSTAVFMAGGFLGYAGGGAISAYLVARFGFRGLYPLVLCPLIGIGMVVLLRVRLAVEQNTPRHELGPNAAGQNRTRSMNKSENLVSFWLIMVMAMPAAISTTVLATLLPTALNELGFELTFGGLSMMVFGLGGAVGSFVWARLGHSKGELRCAVAALLLAIPFLVAYLAWIDHRASIWILFGVGFCSVSAYILMITLSRYARGLTLGQRMGLIVGGTWALAYLVFTPLLRVAEHFGSDVLLKFSPLGYLASGLFGLAVMVRARNSARRTLSVQQPATKT